MDNIASKIIGLLLITLVFVGIIILISNPKPDADLVEKINSLELKIDSLSTKKDSIKTQIITIDKEIIKNKEIHEKVFDTIIIQSNSLDSIFARNYIQRFIDERIR